MADQIGARIVVKLLTRVLIEVAVAADGVSDGRMYPDDPVSGMAFTTEGDLDTQVPQEGLRAAQAAGERPGTFGSAGAGARGTAPAAIGADTEKVGGTTCPRAALGHWASIMRSIAVLRFRVLVSAQVMSSRLRAGRLAFNWVCSADLQLQVEFTESKPPKGGWRSETLAPRDDADKPCRERG